MASNITDNSKTFKYDLFFNDQRAIGSNRIQDLEKITKKLLYKYDLFNTIIDFKNIDELNDEVLKCDNKDNIDNILKNKKMDIRKNIAKKKYDYCKNYKNKPKFNNNVHQSFKTFLFRNVAVTHKFTNDKLVYNILYLFLEKIKLHSGANKINLLNLNTKLPIHKGARQFYENYGFISYIKNFDCVYTAGKESCEIDTRNRFSI